MPLPQLNFLSIHGRVFGLVRGLFEFGGSHLAGDKLAGVLETVASGITATASGTQSTSLVLSATINQVSTVANAADGVQLPVGVAGMHLMIVNDGSNALQVFGNNATGDTIDAVATATGVALTNARRGFYYCYSSAIIAQGGGSATAGKWVSYYGLKSA